MSEIKKCFLERKWPSKNGNRSRDQIHLGKVNNLENELNCQGHNYTNGPKGVNYAFREFCLGLLGTKNPGINGTGTICQMRISSSVPFSNSVFDKLRF